MNRELVQEVRSCSFESDRQTFLCRVDRTCRKCCSLDLNNRLVVIKEMVKLLRRLSIYTFDDKDIILIWWYDLAGGVCSWLKIKTRVKVVAKVARLWACGNYAAACVWTMAVNYLSVWVWGEYESLCSTQQISLMVWRQDKSKYHRLKRLNPRCCDLETVSLWYNVDCK